MCRSTFRKLPNVESKAEGNRGKPWSDWARKGIGGNGIWREYDVRKAWAQGHSMDEGAPETFLHILQWTEYYLLPENKNNNIRKA